MPRLAAELNLQALWVKRDDCTGLARQGRFRPDEVIVWIHTGGGPGLFAYPTTMARLSAKS